MATIFANGFCRGETLTGLGTSKLRAYGSLAGGPRLKPLSLVIPPAASTRTGRKVSRGSNGNPGVGRGAGLSHGGAEATISSPPTGGGSKGWNSAPVQTATTSQPGPLPMSDPRALWIAQHPGFPWLSADDLAGTAEFLQKRHWLAENERVLAVARAGEGNMNLTLRVETDRRSGVLKQARPWVEKYPQIPAPWGRSAAEHQFYEIIAPLEGVSRRMPRLWAADDAASALWLEFFPAAADCTSLYQGDRLTPVEIDELAEYLVALHAGTAPLPRPPLPNRQMRALNHQHIFDLPLQAENGLNLDRIEPGLSRAAEPLRHDQAYRALVQAAGQRYLADGPLLVHGDYFPGSWLRTADGLRVIDPEFGHDGTPEWDLGCALAHLALAQQPLATARGLFERYEAGLRTGLPAVGPAVSVQSEWVARFAGIEVMRRLIGVAQLPLEVPVGFRAELLARSRCAVRESNWELLWNLPE